MGHCRDCKHWGDIAWEEKHWERFPAMAEQRFCNAPNPLFLSHGEGVIMEGIATKPEFGCVQFEVKS